jgi:hypothetical protein
MPHASARPQRGTAENGYYPPGHQGDTFTGAVTAADDPSRAITLTYTNLKSGKTETLIALLEEGYTAHWKDGTLHEVKPSDIPVGTHLKVYYMTAEHKADGKKTKTTTIFEIAGVPNVKSRYSTFQPH